MNDSKHILGILADRRDVSSDLWIVRIRPEEKISFAAGQYVTVGLPGNGRLVERPYSVASSPAEQELELFLELVHGGQLTPPLHHVPIGADVFLRRSAKGRFLFDEKSGHPNHLMVATVTGVAPYVSMLRTLVYRAREGTSIPYKVVVLQAASLSAELGYCDELAGYAREHEWFHYIPTVSRIWLEPEWAGERGRAEDLTRKYLDAFGFTGADTTAYVCGNPNMIENVKGALKRAGLSKESIKEEVYWVATQEAGSGTRSSPW
jgi:ferredoxin--NADP+ reductase